VDFSTYEICLETELGEVRAGKVSHMLTTSLGGHLTLAGIAPATGQIDIAAVGVEMRQIVARFALDAGFRPVGKNHFRGPLIVLHHSSLLLRPRSRL